MDARLIHMARTGEMQWCLRIDDTSIYNHRCILPVTNSFLTMRTGVQQ